MGRNPQVYFNYSLELVLHRVYYSIYIVFGGKSFVFYFSSLSSSIVEPLKVNALN